MLEKNACVILTCSVFSFWWLANVPLFISNEVSVWFFFSFFCFSSYWQIFPLLLKSLCLCLLSPPSSVEQSWLSWMLYYHWQQPAVTALSWRYDQALWRRVAGQLLPCWAVCRRGPWRYHPLHPWGTCPLCCPLAFTCINDCSTTMPGWKIQILLQLKCKERVCACVCALVGNMAWGWNSVLLCVCITTSTSFHSSTRWMKDRNWYPLHSIDLILAALIHRNMHMGHVNKWVL